MASRELKDEEAAELTGQVIALDGIAVIVNKENTIDELTSEDVLNIYTGATVSYTHLVPSFTFSAVACAPSIRTAFT